MPSILATVDVYGINVIIIASPEIDNTINNNIGVKYKILSFKAPSLLTVFSIYGIKKRTQTEVDPIW